MSISTSSIKPTEEDIAKHTGRENVRKKPALAWNDQSYKSWIAQGFDPEDYDYHQFDFNRQVMLRKHNQMDERQSKVRSVILAMFRIKAPDYNDNGEQIGDKSKEWLYYEISHHGKDIHGQPVVTPQLIEGRHSIPTRELVINKYDSNTGEAIGSFYKRGISVVRYTIPFEGKKQIDAVLKKWGNEDRKDEILWYIKVGNNRNGTAFRNNQYTYSQFVNSEFEHLEYLGRRSGGPTGLSDEQRIEKSGRAYHAPCQCSNCNRARDSKSSNIQ